MINIATLGLKLNSKLFISVSEIIDKFVLMK